MPLEVRYDAKADRMRLTLRPPEGPARAFWLTRRQWLGWLHALLALCPPPADAFSGQTSGQASPRAARAARQPAHGGDAPAEPLEAIRLRRIGEGVQLIFVSAGEGEAVRLTLPATGIRAMVELLEQQADRAGWDAPAAMARLNAAALARVAVGRASRSK